MIKKNSSRSIFVLREAKNSFPNFIEKKDLFGAPKRAKCLSENKAKSQLGESTFFFEIDIDFHQIDRLPLTYVLKIIPYFPHNIGVDVQ
jgi:hypothetical protein